MTTSQLLKENPKSTKVIHDYYLNFMLDSLKDGSLPEEFKNFVREKGLEEHNIVEMIEGNPRTLFDVFDKHGIIISITYNRAANKFCYFINEYEDKTHFDTRKEADKDAVATALNSLEAKLNALEKTNQDS
jgi:hypothetical protein